MSHEQLYLLHPVLQQRREDMIRWWSTSLDEPRAPGYHPLMAAESDLRNAIECAVLCLADLARRFLIRSRATLKEVFASGVQPYIGGPPVAFPEWNDDADLDRHWAIAYKTRFLIGLLLDRGDEADLRTALSHMDALIVKTNGLSGPIKGARLDIVKEHLWLAIAARDCAAALQFASGHFNAKVTPKTRIRGYQQPSAYVRAFFTVAKCMNGDAEFEKAARESLRSLLEAHRDFEHDLDNVLWPGAPFAFEWAWLWECAFRDPPDAAHAIEIVRGTASLAE